VHISKVGILARPNTDGIEETLGNLIDFLQNRQLDIVCEFNTARLIPDYSLKTSPDHELGKHVDLVIVVGGDGSMLRAAKSAMKYDTPVIGINKGRLGFLTDIRPTEIETRLAQVLDGDYWIGERFFLQSHLTHDGNQIDCGLALNDVVLSPGRTPHMLEFEIFVDDSFMCSHRADGLITATPTGSTAYALSGGGPIIQPGVDALVVLPMFSHALTSRPIVIKGDSKIRIEFSANNETSGQISCNGNEVIMVPPGSTIDIQKYDKKMKLVHPNDYDYYETLRSKLYWGHKL
tara:strand:+ start:91173 stop:92045 length:873 start_codon:yes stop_codon:yes gene_type:complete